MKTFALIFLVAVCYVECRKIAVPYNKNANVDFINMESGGMRPYVVEPPKPVAGPAPIAQPAGQPQPSPVAKPAGQPQPSPVVKPAIQPLPSPVAKPAGTQYPAPVAKPAAPQPQKPVQPIPTQIKPVPVNPAPVANPITTPGPGSVQALINYYDSQGKASPIRPYSYSQAVKQG